MARPSSAAGPNSCRPCSSRQNSAGTPKPRDYILTEKLGSGTYATVYKAYKKVSRDNLENSYDCLIMFIFVMIDLTSISISNKCR